MVMRRTAAQEQQAFERWGFTNDPQHIEAVRAFVAAAVADGWSIEPTYGAESVERAAKLRRDGYVIQVLARDNDGKGKTYRYEACLNGWAPDGLTVKLPREYDWQTIRDSAERCEHCGAQPVKTFRYSFAGRACSACLPALKKEYEKPGWDN